MWPGLSLTRCQLVTTATTTRASRVAAGSLLPTCRRHYPGRFDGTYSLVLFHQRRPFPKSRWVGSCINRFEACSAFTHVTACMLAKSPTRPSTPEAPTASLPSPPLRLLPGGANSSRAGLSPAVNQRLSRRTCNRDLSTIERIVE